MLRTLITQMYGGKIDDDDDFEALRQLVAEVVDEAAFEGDHILARGATDGENLIVPDGRTMEDFVSWVAKLPEREPPTYLGLPADAEKVLLVGQGQRMITDVEKISGLVEEEAVAANAVL
jgi:dynein heavy chain 1, cytosolic